MSENPGGANGSACRIAIVDDEASIRETLAIAFGREGYAVSTYRDGLEAWEALRHDLPDLAILDVSMPRLDGLELCKLLRGLSRELPMIFLSSRDEEIDRILGLELGGDDYVTKPFSLRELLVRVKVLRRRAGIGSTPGADPVPIARAGWHLDEESYSLHWHGVAVNLTVTEFRIAACLFRVTGHVKTREQLIAAAYPEPTFVDSRTMDTHIKRMRRKFEAIDPDFTAIEAVPGLGYRSILP